MWQQLVHWVKIICFLSQTQLLRQWNNFKCTLVNTFCAHCPLVLCYQWSKPWASFPELTVDKFTFSPSLPMKETLRTWLPLLLFFSFCFRSKCLGNKTVLSAMVCNWRLSPDVELLGSKVSFLAIKVLAFKNETISHSWKKHAVAQQKN